jgi:hypothetical protein
MLEFSSLEVELFYLKAVADYTKHKINLAKSENKPTEELEKKLQYDKDIIEQFERRLKASH